MKTISKALSIIILLLTTSCLSDDTLQLTPPSDADVVGQWVLIAINSTPQIDIGNDGTTDTNLMLQTTCFDGWGLNFDANGTITSDAAEIELDPNAPATLICTPISNTGTYVVNGNNIMVSTTVDGVEESQTVTVNITNDLMSFDATESDVAGLFNIPDGEFYSNLTSLEFVLQKVN